MVKKTLLKIVEGKKGSVNIHGEWGVVMFRDQKRKYFSRNQIVIYLVERSGERGIIIV